MEIQELSTEEIEAVAGGDLATGVAYGTGLATSVGIGCALGPVGAAVGGLVYTLSFGAMYWWQRANRF